MDFLQEDIPGPCKSPRVLGHLHYTQNHPKPLQELKALLCCQLQGTSILTPLHSSPLVCLLLSPGLSLPLTLSSSSTFGVG